jgi:ribosomal protein L40E
METDVGFVCGRCDAFAPFDAGFCPVCGAELGFPQRRAETAGLAPAQPGPSAPGGSDAEAVSVTRRGETPLEEQPPPVGPVRIPAGFVLTEALMDQARTYVCKKCYTPVPHGHKFCGRCGESVPRDILTAQTMILSKALEPGKAKLLVIKGEGFSSDAGDETAYLLGGR